MRIIAVLETSGGWSGTEPSYSVYRAFHTEAEALAYISEMRRTRKDSRSLWSGEMWTVELADQPEPDTEPGMYN